MKCLVCGRDFINKHSLSDHRRHHQPGFSEKWRKKIEPFLVKKHTEQTRNKISKKNRSVVNCADSSRARARFDYGRKPCNLCASEKSEIHHKDGDPFNNSPENISHLCRRCHMKEDGRLEKLIEKGKESWKKKDRNKLGRFIN